MDTSDALRRLIGGALQDLCPPPSGWASRALHESVQRTVLAGVALWQVAMVFAIVVTPLPTVSIVILGALHTLLAAVSWVAWRRHALLSVLIFLMFLTGGTDYVVSADISSTLTFAACWLINMASGAAQLLLPMRRAVALVALCPPMISAAMLYALPHWGATTAIVVTMTQLAIMAALRLGFPALRAFSQAADEETVRSREAAARLAVLEENSRRLAEDTRLLHDTAVNTLGAIANGGRGVRDLDQVRTRCRNDVEQLSALRSSRAQPTAAPLADVLTLPGLPIRRIGATAEEINAFGERLSPARRAAVIRTVGEAVTNASKHSGAHEVTLTVTIGAQGMTIAVADDGVGFDVETTAPRGIQHSMRDRAAEHALEVEVASEPGAGTRVTIDVGAAERDDADPAPGFGTLQAVSHARRSVANLRLRAAWIWSAGVTLIGIFLVLLPGTTDPGPSLAMVATMILCLLITWVGRSVRDSPVLHASLAALVPVIFLLSAAAVGFGTQNTFHWQALAPTAGAVLLIASSPSRRTLGRAAGLAVATIVAIAAVRLPADPAAGAIVVLAGAVSLGFSAAWLRFQNAVQTIGDRAVRDEQDLFQSELAARLREEASRSYRRWAAAGLDDAIWLLRRLASGDLPIDDPAVRATCDREEAYLRRLTAVGPSLVQLGRPALALIREARERDLDLTIRLGDDDVSTHEAATAADTLFSAAARSVPDKGSLTVTVFPIGEHELRITVVGAPLTLSPPALESLRLPTSSPTLQQIGAYSVLELTLPRATLAVPGSATG